MVQSTASCDLLQQETSYIHRMHPIRPWIRCDAAAILHASCGRKHTTTNRELGRRRAIVLVILATSDLEYITRRDECSQRKGRPALTLPVLFSSCCIRGAKIDNRVAGKNLPLPEGDGGGLLFLPSLPGPSWPGPPCCSLRPLAGIAPPTAPPPAPPAAPTEFAASDPAPVLACTSTNLSKSDACRRSSTIMAKSLLQPAALCCDSATDSSTPGTACCIH